MTRGEIWTMAGTDYAGKPRPAAIVQDDLFDTPGSITVCPFTTDDSGVLFFRLPVDPAAVNGLRERSYLMVDKITTVQRAKCRTAVGRLSDADLVRLNRAMVVFLGLAGSPRAG